MDSPSGSIMGSVSPIIRPNAKRKWTHFHFSAFFITFFAYAMFHATRKTFSNVKGTMAQEWSPTNASLPYLNERWNSHNLFPDKEDASYYFGILDTVFMVAYSMGLFISGALGDRFDLRKVLAYGMWSSALAVFCFGTITEWVNLHNYYFYIIMWMVAGLLQSCGWPCVVAIVGNWFGKSSRGVVMGFWGACPSVGNIIGSYTVSGVLHYGYEYAFLVPSAMMFAFGVICYFGIVSSPIDVGLPDAEEDSDDVNMASKLLRNIELSHSDTEIHSAVFAEPKAIGFFQAFCLPGVLPYSIAYACLKLVNYSFFFWLPFYLQNAYGWSESEADSLSTWYDVGGIVGSIGGGLVSDKIKTRSPVVAVMLLGGPPSLFVYNASPPDKLINAILMVIIGFFIGGAANLISTTIAADLGKQKDFSDNKEALATVTGIVDGTGSAGAALGQLLIPAIQNSIGWKYVFYLFMFMMILTLVCISKIVVKDTIDAYHRFRNRHRRTRLSNEIEDIEPLITASNSSY